MMVANYIGANTFEYSLGDRDVVLTDDELQEIVDARKKSLESGFNSYNSTLNLYPQQTEKEGDEHE